MEQGTLLNIDALLAELGELSRQYQECIAPYQAKIKALEMARDEAAAALQFQMESLEAVLRPAILAAQESRKVPYLTAIYQRREKWDREILFNIAKEVPAVMSAYADASFVQFRKTMR
jgi:hypothetical protein